MLRLENNQLEVLTKSTGAELTSIKLKSNGVQYLWQADPQFWGRHAPILFPIVGKLKNDQYLYDGIKYELPQHGFARDCEFEVIDNSSEQVTYQLNSTAVTLANYPFNFQLRVKYLLQTNSLNIIYSIKNAPENPLYFSIGAHPGFNCPLLPGQKMTDYYLEFETLETITSDILENGLLSGRKKPFLENQKTLPLSKELFTDDAIILEGLKSNKISLKNYLDHKSITFEFPGFPYLGIWSKPQGAPFICIEPWYGIADTITGSGELSHKKGIITLQADAVFECRYKIIID
jgi:galactose mutarotase-like enzyme